MSRTALLHIGVIKTGSTSIQRHLQDIRHLLHARGLHYAGSPGARDHRALADALRAGANGAGAAEPALAALIAALGAELAALPPGVGMVILSSEHFSGLPDAAVTLMKQVLDPLFDRFRVVPYLRRQDEFAVSRHANMVRSGAAIGSAMDVPPPNYQALMDRWARVFGAGAMEPRIFAPAWMPGGDAVTDFLGMLGLPDLAPAAPLRENPNLDPAAILLLRRFSAVAAADGAPEAETSRRRARLAALLQAAAPGAGERPARRDAMAYVARCAQQNEAVRAAWFPSAPSLFPEDFSDYPEEAPAPPPDGAALEIAARLLARLLD